MSAGDVRYTGDGGVVPSSVPSAPKRDRSYRELFGIYRGMVKKTIYPDDPKSRSKERMEYVVIIDGQEYPNAMDMREKGGGIYNFAERIRKETEKSFTGQLNDGVLSENLDGEAVFVMFVKGHGDVPLIVGTDQHPKHTLYRKPKRADGVYDVQEFNGVEFKVDSKGSYAVTMVGRKDKDGKVLNEASKKSQLKLYENGDVEISTNGQGIADLRMTFKKSEKRYELYAQNNQFVMDAQGISLEDKNGNKAKLNPQGISIEDKNGNKAILDGAGIKAEDKNGNKLTKDTSGVVLQDKSGNKVMLSASGISIEDKNGNKITLDAGGININSSANNIKLDGSIYGMHQHIGNLGVPTPPGPMDKNTE